MRKLVSVLACAALVGCTTLEPKYVRPEAPVPASWPAGDASLRRAEAGLPVLSYTQIFRDPKLQALIDRALSNNRDLRIAAANIASARAQYRVQRAELFPQVNAGGGVDVSGGGGQGTRARYSLNAGLNNFELDLFGRIRSLGNSALNQYFSTEAAARAARLSLIAEIATAYFTLASDRTLLRIAHETEANAARSVQLTGARLQGGIASRIDLRQAQTILEQARSDVASQTSDVAQDRNALQLLVGAPVEDALLPASIESADALVGQVPAGLSSEILLRRPDVVEAEYQLIAANARIGAARAALYPRISLTGLAGLASTALTSLFSGGAFTWSAGANASLPIFDAGANRANLQYARAQRELFLARYERTIQTAFREVADALARRATMAEQLAAQIRLVADAQDNYRLTEARYREGIENFLATLVAQRTLYQAQQSLARTRLERAVNLADLYRTLGGDAPIETQRFAPAAPPPR